MKIISLVFLILLFKIVEAQELKVSVPFSTSTPYLEPDGRRDALKISETDFVVLSKRKGALSGPSEYALERYGLDLKPKYQVVLKLSDIEEFKDIFFNGTDLFVFVVTHDVIAKVAKLTVMVFDPETGNQKENKQLHEFQVKDWMDANSKGSVKQSFENAIGSNLIKNFVAPLQYQYEIKYSPDKKKILTYIYDYGQKNLLAIACLFDDQLNKLSQGIVPIDNNFINYGIYPNNRGEVFITNVDKLGRIVVVQYNIETKDHKLLDIQYSSSNRESLKIHILEDDVIYVGNINSKNGAIMGVMYSKFNFSTNLIEKINYHEVSEGLRQTVEHSRSANKKGTEDWFNYEMTDFVVNEYEKVIIVLEKREVQVTGVRFMSSATNNINNWKETMGKVNVEGLLMFSFNKDGELLWENFYLKSQQNDITAGLISSSYVMHITEEGKVRMLFAISDNAAGTYNTIKLVEWDELTGTKLKDIPLPNEAGIGLMKGFTVFWDDKMIIAGRKGILGKKTFINYYKL
ncbi:MAG TPA: hypothetical protein VIK89_15530 [Cytophagaceae bacterium]